MDSSDIKNIVIIGAVVVAASYFKNNYFDDLDLNVNLDLLSYEQNFYNQTADAIEEGFWQNWQLPIPFLDDENTQLITSSLLLMKTSDDVSQLMNAYGARCRPLPDVVCAPEMLFTTIVSRLNHDAIEEINENYKSNAIYWQF